MWVYISMEKFKTVDSGVQYTKILSMLAVICTWLVLIDEGLWLILSILQKHAPSHAGLQYYVTLSTDGGVVIKQTGHRVSPPEVIKFTCQFIWRGGICLDAKN
jgi:hypothetical protein